jgi:hypothetical protein
MAVPISDLPSKTLVTCSGEIMVFGNTCHDSTYELAEEEVILWRIFILSPFVTIANSDMIFNYVIFIIFIIITY